MTNQVTEVGEFFNAWEIYRKVLDNNYMHHREIYQAVGALLRKHLDKRPFKLLDLGCGDASFLAETLQGMTISHYRGFDLSDPALTLAAANIAKLNCDSSLINMDFMVGLTQITERFDIIFSSYALHHLTYEEKAKFFNLARTALTETGILLVVEIMREPTETLPVYLDNYCQWIGETWSGFDEQELASMYQHIHNNDMPETCETLSNLAKSEGFRQVDSVYKLPWHEVLKFSV